MNNAGIIRRADAVDFTEADWDAVIDVNLKAVFFLSQAFARQAFARKAGGAIVNIASLLAFQGGIRIPSYTASKHGVAGLTKLLANEWAAKGINVNAIAPGYIETNNTEALRADPDRSKRHPRPHPRRPLGRALRHRRRRRLPRLPRRALHPRHHPPRRRRLACPLTPSPPPRGTARNAAPPHAPARRASPPFFFIKKPGEQCRGCGGGERPAGAGAHARAHLRTLRAPARTLWPPTGGRAATPRPAPIAPAPGRRPGGPRAR